MASDSPAASPFDPSMQRIRDAAKWLIGASAAVGAALIAGSQLSSIGALPIGWRLIAAVAGVVVALGAVVLTIWVAVQLLLPIGVTLADLEKHWTANVRADVKFFHENPRQLGYDSPTELAQARTAAWTALKQARARFESATDATRAECKRERDAAQDRFTQLDNSVQTVLDNAQYQLLKNSFGAALIKLLGAAVVAAVGIMVFAWAANPPKAVANTTSLRDSDLRNADLRGSDLAGVDLRGADLSGANLKGVDLSTTLVTDATWRHTTCPDGTDSDKHGMTCHGHLEP